MKQSVHEILEHFLAQKLLGNKNVEKESREFLKKLGKAEDEIDHLLIEFDDEWTKEQLFGMGIIKAKKLFILSLFGFSVLAVITIVWALKGVIYTALIAFVGVMCIGMLKGVSEIRDAKHRIKRRAFKWSNWK